MDKEIEEIAPKNLDGSTTVVNTVQKASPEEVAKAAAAEKEKKEDYYVDPLEQEAKMKEKLDKIEEMKALERKRNGEPEPEEEKADSVSSETIRPDMNVSGYFSSGTTAKKGGIMKRPASANALVISVVTGVIGAIYSMFYLITLISTNFSFSTNWIMGWIYAVVVIASIIAIFNGIRSRKVQNETLKRNALIGLVGSGISFIPLVAWLVNWLAQLF